MRAVFYALERSLGLFRAMFLGRFYAKHNLRRNLGFIFKDTLVESLDLHHAMGYIKLLLPLIKEIDLEVDELLKDKPCNYLTSELVEYSYIIQEPPHFIVSKRLHVLLAKLIGYIQTLFAQDE